MAGFYDLIDFGSTHDIMVKISLVDLSIEI